MYILNYITVPALLSILWDRAQKDCTEGLRPVPRYSSNLIGGLVSMQLIGQTLGLEKPNVICGDGTSGWPNACQVLGSLTPQDF